MKRNMQFIGIFVVLAIITFGCETINDPDLNKSDLNSTTIQSDTFAKKAGPNAVFALNFGNISDVADNTAGSAGWVVDREAPETFGTTSFDGDDRLEININEAGPTSGFYGYQGKKYMDADVSYWGVNANGRFSYKLYIDPSWETDVVGQQTGVWPVLGNAEGTISAYPILEYQDSKASDNGEAGFRTYVYRYDENGDLIGEWIYLGIPKQLKIDPEEGGWISVEAQLHKTSDGAALKWRVNNKLVFDERGYNVFSPSTQYLEFIFNNANFGVDQNYYYDDVILTDPGNAGK